MSLKSGFYNSMNGDRKYSATDMSSLFDGLINDGVFMSVGSNFAVTADSGNTVIVGTGRAWFNHTWTYNDAAMNVYLDDSDMVQDRIDAIVLEVNSNDSVRNNTIKVINGTASSSPVNPTLVNEEMIHQYPLAYINRPANSKEISQIDITNAVGTSECPFVTGIIDVNNIDVLVAQWQAKFDTWFDGVKGKLDGDAAGKLSNEILMLRENVNAELNNMNQKVEDNSPKVRIDGEVIEGFKGIDYKTLDSYTITNSDYLGNLKKDTSGCDYIRKVYKDSNGKTYLFTNNNKIYLEFDEETYNTKNSKQAPFYYYDNIAELNGLLYFFNNTEIYTFNGSTFTKLSISSPVSVNSYYTAVSFNGKIYLFGNTSPDYAETKMYSFDGTTWGAELSTGYGCQYKSIVDEDGIHFLGGYYYRYSSSYQLKAHYLWNGQTWTTLASPTWYNSSSSNNSEYGSCEYVFKLLDKIYTVFSNSNGGYYFVNEWDRLTKRFTYKNYRSSSGTVNLYRYDIDFALTTYTYENNGKTFLFSRYCSNGSTNYFEHRIKILEGTEYKILDKLNSDNNSTNIYKWTEIKQSEFKYLPKCNELFLVVDNKYTTILPYDFAIGRTITFDSAYNGSSSYEISVNISTKKEITLTNASSVRVYFR